MQAKSLAYTSIGLAAMGALFSLFLPIAVSTIALCAGVGVATAAAWVPGRQPRLAAVQTPFRRELAFHASALVLLVVFLLLALIELLAIPAAMGKLVVFSRIG